MKNLLQVFFGSPKEQDGRNVTRASAQLDALHQLSLNLDEAFVDPEKTHHMVASSALSLSGAQTSLLLVHNERNATLALEAVAGMADREVRLIGEQPYNEGILGEVLLTGRKVILTARDSQVGDALLKPLDCAHLVAMPLTAAGEGFGVLVVDSRLDHSPYSDNDIRVLEIFAAFSAVVEHGAHIIARLNNQTKRLRTVFTVSRYLSQIHEKQDLFDLITDRAVELTGATSGSLVIFDETNGKLLIKASVGLSDAAANLELDAGEGITGWVFQNGTGLLAEDVALDRRYVSLRDDVRSEVAVPLTDANGVMGVLNVDHTQLNAFTGEDFELLQALADVASGALQARTE